MSTLLLPPKKRIIRPEWKPRVPVVNGRPPDCSCHCAEPSTTTSSTTSSVSTTSSSSKVAATCCPSGEISRQWELAVAGVGGPSACDGWNGTYTLGFVEVIGDGTTCVFRTIVERTTRMLIDSVCQDIDEFLIEFRIAGNDAGGGLGIAGIDFRNADDTHAAANYSANPPAGCGDPITLSLVFDDDCCFGWPLELTIEPVV